MANTYVIMLDLAIVHSPGFFDGRHDYGRILEAMLYYDRVHLIMNGALFSGLCAHLGKDDLQAILGHDSVSATVTPEMLAINTNTSNGISTYGRVMIKSAGTQKDPIDKDDNAKSLHHMVSNILGNDHVSKRDIEKLLKFTKQKTYRKLLGEIDLVDHIFRSFVVDGENLKEFLKLEAKIKGKRVNEIQLKNANFNSVESESGFLIFSDNEMDHIVQDWDVDISWSGVLLHLQNYIFDLYLSSEFSGDIVSRPDYFELSKSRLDLSVQRSSRSWEQVGLFEDIVFDDAHVFAQAVNDGSLSIKDALKVIDKTKKFRQWTKALPPDSGLISEYHKAISKDTILGSFPFSIVRFAFSSLGGVAADSALPLSGIGVSAFDTFVIERLLKGWRPNLFVKEVKKGLRRFS
jgi:hypothetical protein